MKNADTPNENSNNRWKTLKRSHQHTTTQKSHKPQELPLWMGTGFTRPYGGRLMILPVDQNARVLPRQRYLPLDRLCTMLASVLHTSSLLKNLKKTEWCRCGRSRSDAQVSDEITKNSKRGKLKLKEPCKISLSVLKCSQSVKKCSKRAYLRIC